MRPRRGGGFTLVELLVVSGDYLTHRKALLHYNAALLDKMIGISACAALMSYSLYTMSPETVALHRTEDLIYTIPFVAYGMFRYLYQDYFTKKPEKPIRVYLFKDKETYEKHCETAYGRAPSTPFGFYMAKERKMVMNIGTGTGTLAHELVHPLLGEDFPDAHLRLLEDRGVDTSGLQTSAGRTFRWTGRISPL